MTASAELVAAHPLFGLRVRTPRLELVWPTDEQLAAMFEAARRGIHPPETMPFGVPWTDWLGRPDAGVGFLAHHWGGRAAIAPDAWDLHLAVLVDGVAVGGQSLHGASFAAVRTVGTGSWLTEAHQGRGVGTEMRAAVLHLTFEGLGATVATSSAFADNHASLRVSAKLGYEPNGEDLQAPRGEPCRHLNLRLTRERWAAGRRTDIELEGLGPCLPLLGADGADRR